MVASTLDGVTVQLMTVEGGDPEQLHAWVAWLIEPEQVQLRSLIAEIQHAALRDPEVRELLAGYGLRYADLLGGMIAGWQAAGRVSDHAPPQVVAQLFLTLTLGLCTTGSFRPDLLRSWRFRSLLDRQLRLLLGEGEPEPG